ncbi:MAG TPA: tetratricopeptide repeat protein, partial [Candidatus Acidoferrum sp.]|nr:tetratricopeptide repeat protein [Candidatus Acidoferrum sp.]
YFQKNDVVHGAQLLEAEISRDPGNDHLVMTVEQVYMGRGMYSNALAVVERRLSLSPDDPQWLVTRGSIEIALKKYDDAIATLNRVLAARKDDGAAIFQRARAYFLSGQLDAARADYEMLQQSHTNSFVYYYALGEIAWRQHDTNEAIRNYEGYLLYAPPNTTEAGTVSNRLQQLKQISGGK